MRRLSAVICLALSLPLLPSCFLDGLGGVGAVVVSTSGLPDGAEASWQVEAVDGSLFASGTITGSGADTISVDAEESYLVRWSSVHHAVDGGEYTWRVPDDALEVAPVGDGGTREVIAAYTQATGGLKLTATADWMAQARATVTRIAPTAGTAVGSGYFPISAEVVLDDLPPGTYVVEWSVAAREMGIQGRFGNAWSHTYRAETDTVVVTATMVPAVVVGSYTLRSGAFRFSFTGLPSGQLVGSGFTRTDGGVSIGGTFSTTPGLEPITPTEFFGNYTYTVQDVTVDSTTYRAAISPVYAISAALVPVEVVVAYSPLP